MIYLKSPIILPENSIGTTYDVPEGMVGLAIQDSTLYLVFSDGSMQSVASENNQFIINFDSNYVGDKTYEELTEAVNTNKDIVGIQADLGVGQVKYFKFVQVLWNTSAGYVHLITYCPFNVLDTAVGVSKCIVVTCSANNIWSHTESSPFIEEDMKSYNIEDEELPYIRIPTVDAVKNYTTGYIEEYIEETILGGEW